MEVLTPARYKTARIGTIEHTPGQFSYYCEICRRGFNTQTNYSTQKRMHKGLKYNCLYCTKSYVFKQTYDYHQSVRTGQYRFNCDKCGKGFNEKRHLLVTLTISTKRNTISGKVNLFLRSIEFLFNCQILQICQIC